MNSFLLCNICLRYALMSMKSQLRTLSLCIYLPASVSSAISLASYDWCCCYLMASGPSSPHTVAADLTDLHALLLLLDLRQSYSKRIGREQWEKERKMKQIRIHEWSFMLAEWNIATSSSPPSPSLFIMLSLPSWCRLSYQSVMYVYLMFIRCSQGMWWVKMRSMVCRNDAVGDEIHPLLLLLLQLFLMVAALEPATLPLIPPRGVLG